jgi:hypothetical protein
MVLTTGGPEVSVHADTADVAVIDEAWSAQQNNKSLRLFGRDHQHSVTSTL